MARCKQIHRCLRKVWSLSFKLSVQYLKIKPIMIDYGLSLITYYICPLDGVPVYIIYLTISKLFYIVVIYIRNLSKIWNKITHQNLQND